MTHTAHVKGMTISEASKCRHRNAGMQAFQYDSCNFQALCKVAYANCSSLTLSSAAVSQVTLHTVQKGLMLPQPSLADLPDNILLGIFSTQTLCIRDKIRCEQVCKAWRGHFRDIFALFGTWSSCLKIEIGRSDPDDDDGDVETDGEDSEAEEDDESDEEDPKLEAKDGKASLSEEGAVSRIYVPAWAPCHMAEPLGYTAWLEQRAAGIRKIQLQVNEDPSCWLFADIVAALQASSNNASHSPEVSIKTRGTLHNKWQFL